MIKIDLPDFSRARVLVLGDVMLDRYWHGSTSRISPEAPVPVVKVGQHEDRPGGAGNVALNIAALGGQVILLGLTGEDDNANLLTRRLESAGVTCRFQRVNDLPTVTKLRVMSRHQQLIRLDFEEGFANVDMAPMLAAYQETLARIDVVVLSDYGKGALRDVAQLISMARKANKPVLVDPKSKDFAIYHGATLITPNLSEFEAVVGACESEAEIVERGQQLMRKHQLDALLITRGEHGMTLLRENTPELHLPTRAREVYDVTGAGDTVISVLSAALAAGLELDKATALSNLAAGIVVAKMGTATVSIPELRRALNDDQEQGRGVLTQEQLLIAIEDARAHGEKIVMTNGCFDILHAGHVSYLEQAKKLGHRLIVAVNDDDSVKRLKGEGRPINQVAARMQVIAGLASVDWVVPFSEDTPERLICAVKPDCLVKGGDYQPKQIAGYDCVTANGGQVVVLDFVEGCSTTRIINAIKSPKN